MNADTARIGFIGFGNMAQAIACGLIGHGQVDPGRITACSGHFDKLQGIAAGMGVHAVETAAEVVAASDFVVLAVKPHLIAQVVEPVRDALANVAVVSVAAGCDFAFYEGILAPGTRHLSTMPNTPVAIGEGVIACEAQHTLTNEERAVFEELFGHLGLVEWLDAKLVAVAGVVAGCGPAFTAMYLEALGDAAVKHGMPRATAYRLAAQMIAGTGKLHLATGDHPGAMKDAVCSPGGTTICGVASLERDGFRGAVINAIDAIEGK